MKKQLDTRTMENELSQGSVFFQKPPDLAQSVEKQNSPSPLPSPLAKPELTKRHHRDRQKAKTLASERKSVRNSVRKSERSQRRLGLPSLPLPLRRATKRYSFEFYVDQLERLRRIKAEEGLQGRYLNLSDIVRNALDEYLEKLGV